MLGTVAVAGKQADGSQQPPGSGQPGGQVAPVPGYPGYYIATPTGIYYISYAYVKSMTIYFEYQKALKIILDSDNVTVI